MRRIVALLCVAFLLAAWPGVTPALAAATPYWRIGTTRIIGASPFVEYTAVTSQGAPLFLMPVGTPGWAYSATSPGGTAVPDFAAFLRITESGTLLLPVTAAIGEWQIAVTAPQATLTAPINWDGHAPVVVSHWEPVAPPPEQDPALSYYQLRRNDTDELVSIEPTWPWAITDGTGAPVALNTVGAVANGLFRYNGTLPAGQTLNITLAGVLSSSLLPSSCYWSIPVVDSSLGVPALRFSLLRRGTGAKIVLDPSWVFEVTAPDGTHPALADVAAVSGGDLYFRTTDPHGQWTIASTAPEAFTASFYWGGAQCVAARNGVVVDQGVVYTRYDIRTAAGDVRVDLQPAWTYTVVSPLGTPAFTDVAKVQNGSLLFKSANPAGIWSFAANGLYGVTLPWAGVASVPAHWEATGVISDAGVFYTRYELDQTDTDARIELQPTWSYSLTSPSGAAADLASVGKIVGGNLLFKQANPSGNWQFRIESAFTAALTAGQRVTTGKLVETGNVVYDGLVACVEYELRRTSDNAVVSLDPTAWMYEAADPSGHRVELVDIGHIQDGKLLFPVTNAAGSWAFTIYAPGETITAPLLRASRLEVKVEIDPANLIVGRDSYTITGAIKKLSGSVVKGIIDVALIRKSDHKVLATGLYLNGRFELVVAARDLVPNTEYAVVADPGDLESNGYKDTVDTEMTVTYRYDLKLEPVSAKYLDKGVLITGRVVNAAGHGVSGLTVTVFGVSDRTRSNGLFAIVADANQAGTVPVLVAGLQYGSIRIPGLAFARFTAVDSAVHSAYAVNLNIDLRRKLSDENLWDSPDVKYTLTGVKISEDGIVAYNMDESTMSGSYFTKLVLTGDQMPESFILASRGTLVITADYRGGEYTGTVSIDVKDPAGLNVLLTPSAAPGVDEGVDGFTITADVFDRVGNGPDHITYSLDGAGIVAPAKPIAVAHDENALARGFQFTTGILHPPMGGFITVTVNAYDDDNKLIATGTAQMTVSGYVYTLSSSDLTVGLDRDVVVTVKTPKGEYVNNAVVTLSQGTLSYRVSAAEANVNNGRYVLKGVSFDAVNPTPSLRVSTIAGVVMATGQIPVNGRNVYDISLPTAKVTAGVSTDIRLRVDDEDGEPVEWLGGDEFFVDGESYLADYDPRTEVYTLHDVVVFTTAKPVYVEVKTDDDTMVGKEPITVLLPEITVSPWPLTYLYTESVRIRISDPITGNPLPCALTLQGTELYATIKGTDLDTELTDGEMVDYELTGNSGDKSDYRFNLTVVPVDEDEDKDTALLITAIDTHDGTLDVEIPIAFGPANLSLDNRELYVGYSNRVVFTLRNYRGEVMPGRDIYQGTMPIGTTDENGELLYNVIPSASGKVLFKAATDAVRNRFDQYVLAEAGTKQDLTGPVLKVVLPESTSDEILVVTGSVTDETRVASVYVNNIPVAIIPGKTSVFTCQVPLREGPNQISIIALDAAGNGTPFSAVVLRTPPPLPPSVSVVIGAVDPGAGLDVPAYLEPGRTMVPLRFISESQGGEVVWDQPTMAATIRINGRSACVVVGSRTAVIDGMPASLLAAPTLKNGRVFVGLADMARLVGGTTAWDEGTKTATIILP